jgi:hypothetical protein
LGAVEHATHIIGQEGVLLPLIGDGAIKPHGSARRVLPGAELVGGTHLPIGGQGSYTVRHRLPLFVKKRSNPVDASATIAVYDSIISCVMRDVYIGTILVFDSTYYSCQNNRIVIGDFVDSTALIKMFLCTRQVHCAISLATVGQQPRLVGVKRDVHDHSATGLPI